MCCEAACDGQCEVCGDAGACVPVTGEPRAGRAACNGDPNGCGGTCDGQTRDHCTYPSSAQLCGSSCADGQQLPSVCDAEGACVESSAIPCGNYNCGDGVLNDVQALATAPRASAALTRAAFPRARRAPRICSHPSPRRRSQRRAHRTCATLRAARARPSARTSTIRVRQRLQCQQELRAGFEQQERRLRRLRLQRPRPPGKWRRLAAASPHHARPQTPPLGSICAKRAPSLSRLT